MIAPRCGNWGRTKRGASCGRRISRRSGRTSCRRPAWLPNSGLPVSIANDADLAAVGEASFGAGAKSPAMAYLTVSTGIGAGVVNGGRVVRGKRSLAELGHVVIDWRAWHDGEPSTVEELGSGSGVARQAREAGLGAVSSEAWRPAAAGEPRAAAIWEQAIAACAAGVSNLVMSFYPSTVVIGGGMGRQERVLRPSAGDGVAAARPSSGRPRDRPLHLR